MNCPICSAQIEISDKNYGAMFTCPHCTGVYYINLSGEFEVAQHEPMIEEVQSFEPITPSLHGFHEQHQNQSMSSDMAPLISQSDVVAADNVYEGTQLNQINEPIDFNQFNQANALNPADQFNANSANTAGMSEQNLTEQYQNEDHQSVEQMNHSLELNSGTGSRSTMGSLSADDGQGIDRMNEQNQSDEDLNFENQNDQAYNFDQPLDQVLEQAQHLADAVVMTEVADDIQSQAANGQWYQFTISGIDTAQIRELVIEALTDAKLQLDIDRLTAEIHDGRLNIRGLNAVKCAVIAQRLIYIDVQMEWSRYDQE